MAEFYIAKNEGWADALLDTDMLMEHAPDYYGPKLEAVAELRAQDDGTLHKGNEFRRVASLMNVPMFAITKFLDPEWMNKKNFYGWLDRGMNRRYCTYDRRRIPAKRGDMVTFVDGKEI